MFFLLTCFKASLSDKVGLCVLEQAGKNSANFKEKFEKVRWVTERLSQALVLENALSHCELAQLQKEVILLWPCLLSPPSVHPLPSVSPGVYAVTCELGS